MLLFFLCTHCIWLYENKDIYNGEFLHGYLFTLKIIEAFTCL